MGFKMTAGQKIKELRELKRISIRELARCTNVSAMHISNIEKDKVSASPELLTRISAELGANLDELLHLGDRVDPEVVEVIHKNPHAVPSFLRSAKDLTPEEWQKMQKYLERMKGQKAPKDKKSGK